MTKRILALMGVVMMLVLTCVPAYAETTGTTCTTAGTDTCGVLYAMYGSGIEYNEAADASSAAAAGYSYPIELTVNGSPKTVYLKQRPTINEATVKMENGKLNVYGMGTGDANTWNHIFAKYKNVIVGISGIGAITMMALFIIQFMKLGASAGNPQARSQALTGVLWTGIAAALLGAVSIIAGFFYNAI